MAQYRGSDSTPPRPDQHCSYLLTDAGRMSCHVASALKGLGATASAGEGATGSAGLGAGTGTSRNPTLRGCCMCIFWRPDGRQAAQELPTGTEQPPGKALPARVL